MRVSGVSDGKEPDRSVVSWESGGALGVGLVYGVHRWTMDIDMRVPDRVRRDTYVCR